MGERSVRLTVMCGPNEESDKEGHGTIGAQGGGEAQRAGKRGNRMERHGGNAAEGEEVLPGKAAHEAAGRPRENSGDADGPLESVCVLEAPFGSGQESRGRRRTGVRV